MDGVQLEGHCVNSTSATFHGDEWVIFDLVVRGNASVTHIVNGDTVLTYERPSIGGGVVDGFDPAVKVDGTPLASGYIALQSESHPIQFRQVLVRRLDGG
jgi:hypothetical protein